MAELFTSKFRVQTRLLDHIGVAMYSKLEKALSELVANSYDANATRVDIDLSRASSQSKIFISDNGTGMTRQEIESCYLRLGYNKRKRTGTSNIVRSPIGNKGIGKLAGLGIARQMMVESRRQGTKVTITLNRDQLADETLTLDDIKLPGKVEPTTEPDGTTVTLYDLLNHSVTPTDTELLQYMTHEFGMHSDFQICVNGKKQSMQDIPGKRRVIKEDIPGLGSVKGYYVRAERPKDIPRPGFIIRVRGRAVVGPTIFRVNKRPGRTFVGTNYFIGELNADFLDPEQPQLQLDEFTITTARDNFNEQSPRFLKFREWTEAKIIEIAKGVDRDLAQRRKVKLLTDDHVKAALAKMPTKIRRKVNQLLNDIIPKLNMLDEETVEIVLQMIIRASESSEFVEILRRMDEAEQEDLELLVELLQDWGIYEITAITELIRRRLKVIDKFEHLVMSPETLEYTDIHKTLESNLWLLNDNYRLYKSNTTLRKMLQEKIDKKYEAHSERRPDIVAKELQGRLVVIELKRPKHICDATDLVQLMEYSGIIAATGKQYELVESYLIGTKFDEAVRHTKLDKADFYLRSYAEVVQMAKERYTEILAILGQEQDEAQA